MRVKRCEMRYEFLIVPFVQGRKIQCVANGLPDGKARVVGVSFDWERRVMLVDIEHMSFEDVEEGGAIPRFMPTWKILED